MLELAMVVCRSEADVVVLEVDGPVGESVGGVARSASWEEPYQSLQVKMSVSMSSNGA